MCEFVCIERKRYWKSEYAASYVLIQLKHTTANTTQGYWKSEYGVSYAYALATLLAGPLICVCVCLYTYTYLYVQIHSLISEWAYGTNLYTTNLCCTPGRCACLEGC